MSELAWAAGFFDGEGNVSTIRRTRFKVKRGYFRAAVNQVDRRPLDRFLCAVGRGSIKGPYGPYTQHKRPQSQFVWVAYGDAAKEAMESLRPFLSEPKQEQLRSALDLLEELRKNG